MPVSTIRSMTPIILACSLAGCVTTTSGVLTTSAQRLEHSTYNLYDEARAEGVSDRYSRNAQELAEEARDFRHTLSDRKADDDDVQEAFHELSRSYHALRDDVERSRSAAVDREFKPVTQAYLDIEREMRDHRDYRDRNIRG